MSDANPAAIAPGITAAEPSSIVIDGHVYVPEAAPAAAPGPASLLDGFEASLTDTAIARDTGRWNRIQAALRSIRAEL